MLIHPLGVRRVLKMGLALLTFLFDTALLAFRRRGTPGADKILLLVRLDRIGDFLLFLPAAQRIIDAWRARGFTIVLMLNADCMELGQALNGVDRFVPVNRNALKRSPLYRAHILLHAAQIQATEALEPAFSRDISLGDAVMRFSRAKRRMGWQGDRLNTPPVLGSWSDRAYTELFPPPAGAANELLHNKVLLDRLGIVSDAPLSLTLPSSRAKNTQLPARFFVLSPGASAGLRQWPTEKFAQLVSRIHAAYGLAGVVVGDRAGRALFAQIAGQCAAPLVDMTGRTTLSELTGIIADAQFVVGNESSAIHLAATLGKPSVCILGGGHFGRFLPYPEPPPFHHAAPHGVFRTMACYGCNWVCPHVPTTAHCAPCVAEVPMDAVWSAIAMHDMAGGSAHD